MVANNSVKKYNYGVALLKIFMSYEVILCHFWNTGGGKQSATPVCISEKLCSSIFADIVFYFNGRSFYGK